MYYFFLAISPIIISTTTAPPPIQPKSTQSVSLFSAAEAMAEQGVIKEQKNATENNETDWVLFGCIGGGAVVVLIMIGLMAKKK